MAWRRTEPASRRNTRLRRMGVIVGARGDATMTVPEKATPGTISGERQFAATKARFMGSGDLQRMDLNREHEPGVGAEVTRL
jgi:hypothetical protein